jgi:hypothetical protein
MFPFKVRFSRTLKAQINPEQIPDLLNLARDVLSNVGADYFSKENNRLKFENKLFKLTWSWDMMAMVDAGFVEINVDGNKVVKVKYSITLISLWVISSIFAFIILVSSAEIIWALLAFGFLSIGNWLVIVLRHWAFFHTMSDLMIENIKNEIK